MDPQIVVAIITSILGPIIATWFANRRNRKLMSEVHYQVKNNHETNMRQDIDWLMDGMKQLIKTENRHDRELAAVREDVSALQHVLIERRDPHGMA